MTPAEQIKQAIRELVKIPTVIVMGKVSDVKDESFSLTLTDGLKVSDVRLKQNINQSENFFIKKPKDGTTATCISLDGTLSNLMLLDASEWDEIKYIQDGFELIVSGVDKKLTLKNNEVNLYDLFKDLTTLIQNLTVSTPNGPSGTPLPPTIQSLNQFEMNFKKLLKQ